MFFVKSFNFIVLLNDLIEYFCIKNIVFVFTMSEIQTQTMMPMQMPITIPALHYFTVYVHRDTNGNTVHPDDEDFQIQRERESPNRVLLLIVYIGERNPIRAPIKDFEVRRWFPLIGEFITVCTLSELKWFNRLTVNDMKVMKNDGATVWFE